MPYEHVADFIAELRKREATSRREVRRRGHAERVVHGWQVAAERGMSPDAVRKQYDRAVTAFTVAHSSMMVSADDGTA
jgi:hypothetical protein